MRSGWGVWSRAGAKSANKGGAVTRSIQRIYLFYLKLHPTVPHILRRRRPGGVGLYRLVPFLGGSGRSPPKRPLRTLRSNFDEESSLIFHGFSVKGVVSILCVVPICSSSVMNCSEPTQTHNPSSRYHLGAAAATL